MEEQIICKKIKRRGTVTRFLRDYFKERNPATYYKSGGKQCYGSCQRSFGDLYRLCKTEYPSITLKSFGKSFRKAVEAENVGARYCCTQFKNVFMKDFCKNYRRKDYPFIVLDGMTTGHYLIKGNDLTVLDDEFTFNKIINLMYK